MYEFKVLKYAMFDKLAEDPIVSVSVGLYNVEGGVSTYIDEYEFKLPLSGIDGYRDVAQKWVDGYDVELATRLTDLANVFRAEDEAEEPAAPIEVVPDPRVDEVRSGLAALSESHESVAAALSAKLLEIQGKVVSTNDVVAAIGSGVLGEAIDASNDIQSQMMRKLNLLDDLRVVVNAALESQKNLVSEVQAVKDQLTQPESDVLARFDAIDTTLEKLDDVIDQTQKAVIIGGQNRDAAQQAIDSFQPLIEVVTGLVAQVAANAETVAGFNESIDGIAQLVQTNTVANQLNANDLAERVAAIVDDNKLSNKETSETVARLKSVAGDIETAVKGAVNQARSSLSAQVTTHSTTALSALNRMEALFTEHVAESRAAQAALAAKVDDLTTSVSALVPLVTSQFDALVLLVTPVEAPVEEEPVVEEPPVEEPTVEEPVQEAPVEDATAEQTPAPEPAPEEAPAEAPVVQSVAVNERARPA